jgi:hypothetical protein
VSLLDGPLAKLARADEHLGVLEAQMRKELDAKEYTVTREAETKVTEHGTETIVRGMQLIYPPELPQGWALLIGDFAYNARGALDHLAWQLALRNTWRESQFRKARRPWPPGSTEFPVFVRIGSPRDARLLKTKLSYFRPSDRKTIAAEQPYRRGKLAHSQTLWLLHRIRNTDAHRTLHTVLATVPASASGEMVRVVATPEGGETFYFPQLLKEAISRVQLVAGDTLKTTFQVEAKFSLFVAFDQRGADFDGQEVLPLLHRCRDEVERILDLF